MNSVNPFPTLTDLFQPIFLSNLSNTDEVALLANLDQTSLAKRTARTDNIFLPKLSIIVNVLPRDPPD